MAWCIDKWRLKTLEATAFSKTMGVRIILKFKKLSAKILKFKITFIWITSTPTWIVPIRTTPINLPPTFKTWNQTIIWMTLMHYKKYCHGIQWTQKQLLSIRGHLWHIIMCHRYIHTLCYIYNIWYPLHVAHQYLIMGQVTFHHHSMKNHRQ